MRILAIAVVLLLLTACGSSLPNSATVAPSDTVAEVRALWDAEPSLPTSQTERCERDLRTMRVAVVDDAGLERLCAPACAPGQCGAVGRTTEACPYGCAGACVWRECRGGRFVEVTEIGCGHRAPTLVVHEAMPIERATLHEMLHVLSECAMGRSDRVHGSDAVWATGGVLDRAGGQPVR